MKRILRLKIIIFLPVILLFSGILTCARAPRPISPEDTTSGENYWLGATETAAVEQATASAVAFAGTATESAQQTAAIGPTATPTIDLGNDIEEEFTTDTGVFSLTGNYLLENDMLFLGPEDSCALDRPDYVQPAGCLALCQACYAPSGNFSMGVDLMFASGVSEREFGIVLRFVDENEDGLLGDEDYLLVIGINIFTNEIKIYLHEPGNSLPMELIEGKEGGFYPVGTSNRLDVISDDGGRQMDVLINDSRVFRLRGFSSEPGETFIEPWVENGEVGLILLQRGVQVQYDNFIFEPSSP